jgi:hypothetical protein
MLSAAHPKREPFVDLEATAARVHRGESKEKVVPPPKKVESSSEEESDEEETPKPVAKAVKGATARLSLRRHQSKATARRNHLMRRMLSPPLRPQPRPAQRRRPQPLKVVPRKSLLARMGKCPQLRLSQ